MSGQIPYGDMSGDCLRMLRATEKRISFQKYTFRAILAHLADRSMLTKFDAHTQKPAQCAVIQNSGLYYTRFRYIQFEIDPCFAKFAPLPCVSALTSFLYVFESAYINDDDSVHQSAFAVVSHRTVSV